MTGFSDAGALQIGLITTANETSATYPGMNAKKMNDFYIKLKVGTQDKAAGLIDNLKSVMSKKAETSSW
jgi:hypothetical protein